MVKIDAMPVIVAMVSIPAAVILFRAAFDFQPSVTQSRIVLGIMILSNLIYTFGIVSHGAERILITVSVGALLLLVHDWLIKGAGIVS